MRRERTSRVRQRRRWSQRGTASIEIVVMLPVFVVILACVFWLHGLGMTLQGVGMSSRGCAWAHALQGCPKALPPVCGVLGSPLESDGGKLEEISGTGWFDKLDRIPILNLAVRSVFGHGKKISASQTHTGLAGTEGSTLFSTQYVLCNSVAESWSSKIEDLVKSVVDW